MTLSFALIVFIFVSIPAIIQLYVFQYFSRIRRPLETNPIASVSVIVLSASLLHIFCATNIYVFGPGHLINFLNYILLSFSQGDDIYKPYSDGIYIYIHGVEYFIIASIFGTVFGMAIARLSIYDIRPFDLVGRLYYGGLFGAYKGFASYDVRVSVLSVEKIDSKSVIYSGTLEELKLKHSGQIDYITLSGPESRLIENDIAASSLSTTLPRLLGDHEFSYEKPEHDHNFDESEFEYLSDIDSFVESNEFIISQYQNSFENRMIIEGEDIANIFLSHDIPRNTLENKIFDMWRGNSLHPVTLVTSFLSALLLMFYVSAFIANFAIKLSNTTENSQQKVDAGFHAVAVPDIADE